MGKNRNANRPLTHAEIWDDSALVRSWDEAVEEYKLYHSIHARGEDVEDVLRKAEEAELTESKTQNQHDDQDQELDYEPVGEEEVPDADVTDAVQPETDPHQEPHPGEKAGGPEIGPSLSGPGAASMPHAILTQVQDESLKNLMMAWYFAGYYTGLHEGQQRAQQNVAANNNNGNTGS
ncbi:hypothetical protein MAP00_006251 [Monascus purpureus]|nr:hypothetical protein MAP00_006251 [Monascus purpureus]